MKLVGESCVNHYQQPAMVGKSLPTATHRHKRARRDIRRKKHFDISYQMIHRKYQTFGGKYLHLMGKNSKLRIKVS